MSDENRIARLQLPRRWELLEQRAEELSVNPHTMVERVDDAAQHLDKLFARVQTGGGGVIEVIFGKSGSGKTTFLRTIDKFFENVKVIAFDKEKAFDSLPDFIRRSHNPLDKDQRVILIQRRDNPKPEALDKVQEVFSDLLDLFREPEGQVVVLWPITDDSAAEFVATTAWQIGRDSMADRVSRGRFDFKGLPSSKFALIADNTSRNLSGDSLDAFGVDERKVAEFAGKSDTISDFFGELNAYADEIRGRTWSVLKERSIVHSWVVLPGDDPNATSLTVSALTQGMRNRIDIDAIAEFLDRPDSKSLYIENWKKYRSSMAHLLRAIDARLFNIPPNVALGAVRRFGSPTLKAKLNQGSANLDQAKDATKATRLYKAILTAIGIETTPYAGKRGSNDETADEYIRIQRTAANDDKPLNKALGALIAACLEEDAPEVEVVTEKKSIPGSELRPDIQIKIGSNEFICLEPTWRSTGRSLDGAKSTQNTLAEAHMKKYVLEKYYDYVNGIGLI